MFVVSFVKNIPPPLLLFMRLILFPPFFFQSRVVAWIRSPHPHNSRETAALLSPGVVHFRDVSSVPSLLHLVVLRSGRLFLSYLAFSFDYGYTSLFSELFRPAVSLFHGCPSFRCFCLRVFGSCCGCVGPLFPLSFPVMRQFQSCRVYLSKVEGVTRPPLSLSDYSAVLYRSFLCFPCGFLISPC